MTATPSPLDQLLDYLKLERGFDFTGYKRTTLERRLAKRMEAVGVDGYVDYRDHLEVNAGEFEQLFNTILINVTGFFRDPTAWEHVAKTTIPALLAEIGAEAPIRVWCAGCSTGEETYTIAMLLAEALGTEAYLRRVKIYATDVDDEALAIARAAVYSHRDVEALPPGFLERWFEPQDRRNAVRKDLRRTVIFGRNDLVQDAPISRIDLLTCRNTLMYFNAETQAKVLGRFSFALNDWGTLLLGKSEMLITHSDLFVPRDLKRRVFAKARPAVPSLRSAVVPDAPELQGSHLLELAFDTAPGAQLVVDAEQRVVALTAEARALFSVGPADLGRPLRELELSYRPVDLRTTLEQAVAERRTISLGPVAHGQRDGEQRTLEIEVSPAIIDGEVAGATVVFTDVSAQHALRVELDTARAELDNAYEELQSTVEELETMNEELQSTNEELETTNEELQSTNEELETMNEELQSTNEELETINDELRTRTVQLNEVNGFLETILSTMETAVVVVDARLVVQLWNGHAQELFGLRPTDVRDQALLGLDIGLPVGELADPLRSVLAGNEPRQVLQLAARNRRGRDFTSRVTVLPLDPASAAAYGALLLIAEVGPDGMPPGQHDGAVTA